MIGILFHIKMLFNFEIMYMFLTENNKISNCLTSPKSSIMRPEYFWKLDDVDCLVFTLAQGPGILFSVYTGTVTRNFINRTVLKMQTISACWSNWIDACLIDAILIKNMMLNEDEYAISLYYLDTPVCVIYNFTWLHIAEYVISHISNYTVCIKLCKPCQHNY